jgi:hypothetical protein
MDAFHRTFPRSKAILPRSSHRLHYRRDRDIAGFAPTFEFICVVRHAQKGIAAAFTVVLVGDCPGSAINAEDQTNAHKIISDMRCRRPFPDGCLLK